MTLTTYEYIPQCTFQVQSQKHKYEANKSPNLHYHSTRLHIITSPHMRVIVPEHKTRSAIPNILLLETCLSSGSLPSKPDPCDRALTGVGSHTVSNGRKGSGKRHLPRRPLCSPLPNPSPCNRTLGPLTPDRNLTENTIRLWSAYLSGAGTPIGTPDNLSI